MVRKEVSTREVLKVYDMAKIHALNYIHRKEFPNSPAIYQAICYWAAGLLSEKAHFRDDKVQESALLIEEARRLLSPHVKKSQDFFIVSGDDFFWEEYMRQEEKPHPRRDRMRDKCDKGCDEPKELSTHGHFHEHFHYKPPLKFKDSCHHHDLIHKGDAEWFLNKGGNKYKIETEPIISYNGETALIKSRVTKHGVPCRNGRLVFYIYEE